MLVKQVENVLSILEYFAARQRPATVAELVEHFDWPRSSTFNIVSTLAEKGYLYEPRARGAYYPTPRWLAMAQAVSAAEPVPAALIRVLDRLVEETGETVWIAGASGLNIVVLEVRESPQLIRYAAQVGTRLPIHVTGTGQALISRMSPGEQDALLKRIRYRAYNRNTPQDEATVRAQIAEAEARGWFMSASAYSSDLGGVSVPVEVGGRVYGVTAAGPEARVLPRLPEFGAMIRDAIASECGTAGLVPAGESISA